MDSPLGKYLENMGFYGNYVLFIGRVLWINIRLGSVDGSRAGDCRVWYPGSRSPSEEKGLHAL
jgi:hypothetical protein